MSQEQANTFRKYREAQDPQGNLAWALRLQQKALRQDPEAAGRLNVERDFELTDDERAIWRLLKLPRKYMDLEHCGLFSVDLARGVLRGFVAADVVDIVEISEAKALLPAEIKRVKAQLAGKEVGRPREPLRGRVYRPDISGGAPGEAPPAQPAPPSEPPAASVPAPVELREPARAQASSPGTRSPASRSAGGRAPATSSPGMRAPAHTAPGTGLDDDERFYVAEIERAFAAAQTQNHYEFLGLQRPTDDAAVRAAYVRLAREYHPDRVTGVLGKDEGLKAHVDGLFKRLGEAQAAVANAEARSQYDRTLNALGEQGQTYAGGKRQRRPLEAKNAYLMAETYFKKKDLKQAEAHYRQAAVFDPEDPKILTALAFCIWLNPDHDDKQRAAEARKRLSEVVTTYRYGDAAYKLGLLLRKEKDEAGAQRQFSTANRLDPDHVEAQREVRLTQSRHKKAEQERKDAGSFLGKLGLKK